MKKELLFFAISLCVSTLNAQTISSTVAPKSTSVELGGTLEVDVTLSNITTNVVLSIDLNKYDDNDANVADWVASGELTITNSDDVTVNIAIGSTIASSISLDEG